MGLGTRLGAAGIYYEVGYDNSGAYELQLGIWKSRKWKWKWKWKTKMETLAR